MVDSRMVDREKVIKGLEKLRKDLGCGLPDRSNVVVEYLNSLTDAIALLREQETTFVLDPDRYQHYYCEKCGYVTGIIARMHKFCPECGRKVKWDG